MEPPENNTHIPYIKASIEKMKEAKDSKLVPAARLLRQWLIKNNMTAAQLAMRCGFSATTIWTYISGAPNTYPSLAQAYAIEYTTNGTVPAWMWLDNPYIQARVRNGQLAGSKIFEKSIKSFVLKYNSLKTTEGMIRHRARILSRLFGVDWGEVKKRVWADAKERSKVDRADISHLLYDDITAEEQYANDTQG